jgi:hypothetical protein
MAGIGTSWRISSSEGRYLKIIKKSEQRSLSRLYKTYHGLPMRLSPPHPISLGRLNNPARDAPNDIINVQGKHCGKLNVLLRQLLERVSRTDPGLNVDGP